MNLTEYNTGDQSAQTLLFVGDSGTGKSIAAADWRKENDPRPIYFASCDNRMGSVAEWHRGRTDIYFDSFTDFEPLNDKVNDLEADCPYQTIILDPVTKLSDFLMRYSFSLRGVMEFDEATGRARQGSKGKKKGVVNMTTIEDFGVEHRGITDLIANLKIIGVKYNTTIIVTAHLITTQYTKPGGTESHIRRDILTAGKKVAAFLPIDFDEFYHFYTENERWMVKTYNDGIVPARSSFLLMPKEIDWTTQNLYSKMSKYYIKSEENVQ